MATDKSQPAFNVWQRLAQELYKIEVGQMRRPSVLKGIKTVNIKKLIFFAISLILTPAAALAPSTPPKPSSPIPLSFKAWKDSQSVEARNQVTRLTNKITLARANLKEGQDANLASVEVELKTAEENLKYASELTIKEYFEVYLAKFKDDPKAIQSVVDQLSKEEVAELLKNALNQRVIEPTTSAQTL